MDPVLSAWIHCNLGNADQGSEESMIGKDDIVEVDLASLIAIDEIPIGIVQRIEDKTSEVHGHEIEVHAFNTTLILAYLFRL